MKNSQIMQSIKASERAGIEALAGKYGITVEQAEQIGEAIVKRNAHSIRKMKSNGFVPGFKILVGWHGHGYLGSFDTNTEFCFNEHGNLYAVYGE